MVMAGADAPRGDAPADGQAVTACSCGASGATGCRVAEHARAYQREIDAVFRGDATLGRGRGLSRLGLGSHADPEMAKNLLIFRRLVGAAGELCHRRALPDAEQGRLCAVMPLDELTSWMSLDKPAPWQVRVLLARRFELEHVLVELGDRAYLVGRLADLYSEGPGSHVTWKDLFGDQLPALLDAPGRAVPYLAAASGDSPRSESSARAAAESACAAAMNHEVKRARLQLTRLLRAKETQDQVMRARQELIDQAVPRTTLAAALLTAALVVMSAVVFEPDQRLLLALAAGGTGAALGGLVKLRDQVRLGAGAAVLGRVPRAGPDRFDRGDTGLPSDPIRRNHCQPRRRSRPAGDGPGILRGGLPGPARQVR